MSGWKKLASAAAASGEALNVEDVFSTYLYKGTSANQSITNGVDLSTEGGLVWVKNRDNANDHVLVDTERGALNYLHSNQSYAQQDATTGINAFNTDGFDVDGIGALWNNSSYDYASWTFRKAPKFFDIQKFTITRDGSNNLSSSSSNVTITSGIVYISHDLGSAPAIWTQKSIDASSNWYVRGTDFTGYLQLNKTNAKAGSATFSSTSTQVELGNYGYFGTGTQEYVVYLFAHNNADGEFGPTGDQDIIKCGSFTYSNGLEVDLGFEPQWLLYKQSSTTGHWRIVDNMRGWGVPSTEQFLYPSLSNAEAAGGQIDLTSTGFKVHDAGTGDYIYIAIRRGPMAVPESATDVFDMDFLGATSPNPPAYNSSGWPVDMGIQASVGTVNSNATSARLIQGNFLRTDSTQAQTGNTQYAFDFQDGWRDSTAVSNNYLGYMWRRAPNFFDVVAYTGNSTAGRTVSHNLGVAPEMMWVKKRSGSDPWAVYHTGIGENAFGIIEYLRLNETGGVGFASPNVIWNDTDPTDSVFTLGLGGLVNESGATYIAYLFASLDGISKVGSYTGNATNNRVIDCGFSSGARFVLIKEADNVNYWFLFDSERGITTASTDGVLRLNETTAQAAESTYGGNLISPHNSGFMISNLGSLNNNGGSYIFYAIA